MRRWFAVLLIGGMSAGAVEGPRPASTLSYEAARSYAASFSQFAQQVRLQYVFKLHEAVLLEAGVQGLYEAARKPPPANLRAILTRADESERFPLLIAWRQELGDDEAVRGSKGLHASIRALTRVLDPHTCIIPPRDLVSYTTNQGERRMEYGTGIEFANAPLHLPTSNDEILQFGRAIRQEAPPPPVFVMPTGLTIQTVIPGSPAQQAGLRPGDVINKLFGTPIEKVDNATYYRAFFAEQPREFFPTPRRPAVLEVSRPGESVPRRVDLTTANYRAETLFGVRRRLEGGWDCQLDPAAGIGYVRFGYVTDELRHRFSIALDELQSSGGRGVILDLRWCPGGYLTPACTIVGALLPAGTPVVTMRYRNPMMNPDDDAFAFEGGGPRAGLTVLVLIGNETMGGGELIAACLQDHARVIVAGDRTVGKATIQNTMPFNSDLGLSYKITTGLFHRPSGRNLQRRPHHTDRDDWGVRPDAGRSLPVSPEVNAQLKQWWTWQSLRPAGSREALPTDDPEADPQLNAAVRMIRELVAKKS